VTCGSSGGLSSNAGIVMGARPNSFTRWMYDLVRFDDGQGAFCARPRRPWGSNRWLPPGSTGPIQSEFGAGANPLFCRAWISVKCSRAICAASAPCQGLVAGSAVPRDRHGPDLYQLARARNVQCEHRSGRKTCGCAGHRTGRIAAACVEAEPKQIRKRRSRVTMTIERCALATVL